MPYTAITNDEIQVKRPIRQELMQKIKDNFDDHELRLTGQGSSGGGVPNGSFETDTDNNGIPDAWTRSLYPGGSGAFEIASPAHGVRAYRLTHPGGPGNGGGHLDSDFIETSVLQRQILSFIHWSSAAGMRNIVQILYYDRFKVYLSALDIYNSITNPTSPTYFVRGFTPTAPARYFKIRVIGGATSVNVAGHAYFDGFTLGDLPSWSFHGSFSTSGIIALSSWVDVSSAIIPLPFNCNLSFKIVFGAWFGAPSSAHPVSQRFRIDTTYSTINTTDLPTPNFIFYEMVYTPPVLGVSSVTIVQQLHCPGGNGQGGAVSFFSICNFL